MKPDAKILYLIPLAYGIQSNLFQHTQIRQKSVCYANTAIQKKIVPKQPSTWNGVKHRSTIPH